MINVHHAVVISSSALCVWHGMC